MVIKENLIPFGMGPVDIQQNFVQENVEIFAVFHVSNIMAACIL